MAEGVAHGLEARTGPDHAPGVEDLEVELRGIQLGLHLLVCRKQDLEAAVQKETLDLVRTDPPPDVICRLDDVDVEALTLEKERAGEAGKTGADDEDFGV
jgi:hypothetical protein